MTDHRTTRRNFLLTSMVAAGGIIGSTACQDTTTSSTSHVSTSPASEAPPQLNSSPPPSPAPIDIPQRIFGRTQINIPIFGLGGAGRTPLSRPNEEQEAIAIIERALELGIRYFDTAASYGPSEERLGKVLPPHRADLFLATKTGRRDRDGAWQELEQSLQRLQTDYIDLWQFHALTYEWDLNTLLDEQNGAIKAAQEAQEQGLIRFIGISGHHNPDIIAESLRRHPFDTALIPINAADRHTANPFITGVLPIAQQQNTGIIAMKVPAYGRLIETGAVNGMRQAMGYALSQGGVHSCIIAAETVPQLEQNITVAQAFQPLEADEMSRIEQQTAADWENFSFFRQWT